MPGIIIFSRRMKQKQVLTLLLQVVDLLEAGVLHHVTELVLHVLDLIDVDVLVLFLHLFQSSLHGVDCYFRVFQH